MSRTRMYVFLFFMVTVCATVCEGEANDCFNADGFDFANGFPDPLPPTLHTSRMRTVQVALGEAFRVLRPGGRLMVLEFSHLSNPLMQQAYDSYSFAVIPKLGEVVAKDAASYQYLVESIRRFPKQVN